MRRVLALPFLLAGLAGSAALAQQAPAASPCQADVARLCPNVQPGRGAIRACLQQNTDQLSAECKAHIDQAHQRFEAMRAACQPDVEKFCADVTPGGHRIAACLRAHASELSQACQAQRSAAWNQKKSGSVAQ